MRAKLSAIFLVVCGLVLAQSTPDVLLLSECSDSSQIRRIIQNSDVVEVRHSLAGGAQTCYSVSIATGGENVVEGFLLGARHPAVIAFERNEQAYSDQALPQPPGASQNRAKAPAPPKHYARRLWNPFASPGTK